MSPITQHYVFGYGSLICSQSRAISAPTLATRTALPVRIQNVVRTWNKRSSKSGATYLGVQQVDDSIVQTNNKKKHNDGCVGVLIPMDTTSTENAQEELEALDDREIGYDRQYVPLEWIHRVDDLLDDANGYDGDLYKGTFLDSSSNMTTTSATENTAVWMYVPQISQPATLEYPIVQSYVDICLRGCLSISESFLHEFITSTIGWNPQDLIDLESILNSEDNDDDQNMDDTSSEAASSQGWHHRSSSSLSSYPSYMMRGSHNRNNSEFSSLSSFMDLDNDDDDDQLVGDTATTDDSRDVPKSITTTPNDAWVNDRKDPLYMRADRTFSLENAKVIDELIMSTMTSSAATTKKQQRSHRLHGGGSSNIMAKQKSLWNKLRVTRGKKELNNIRKRNQFFTGIKSQ